MARAPVLDLERCMNFSDTTGTGNMLIGAHATGYCSLLLTELVDNPDLQFEYCIEGIEGACLGEVEIGRGWIVGSELIRGNNRSIVAGEWVNDQTTFSTGMKRIFARAVPPTETGVNLHHVLSSMRELAGSNLVTASQNTDSDTPTTLYGSVLFSYFNLENETIVEGETIDMSPLLDDAAFAFDLLLKATDGVDSKLWRLTFLVQWTVPDTVTLVGSPAVDEVAATGVSASWSVGVDTVDQLIRINVTGEEEKEIRWELAGRFF